MGRSTGASPHRPSTIGFAACNRGRAPTHASAGSSCISGNRALCLARLGIPAGWQAIRRESPAAKPRWNWSKYSSKAASACPAKPLRMGSALLPVKSWEEADVDLPLGYRYAATYAGIRQVAQDDLALIVSGLPAAASAVFTQ